MAGKRTFNGYEYTKTKVGNWPGHLWSVTAGGTKRTEWTKKALLAHLRKLPKGGVNDGRDEARQEAVR